MQRSSALSKLKSTWVWHLNDHRKPQRVTPPPFYSWHLPEPEWPAWARDREMFRMTFNSFQFSHILPSQKPTRNKFGTLTIIDIHWPQKVNRTWHHMTPLMTRYFKACHVCSLARRTHEDAEAPTASTGIPARTIIRSSSRSERAARNTSHFQNLTQICPWTSLWIHERGPIWSHQCPSGVNGQSVKSVKVRFCSCSPCLSSICALPTPFSSDGKVSTLMRTHCAHVLFDLVWMTRRGMQFTIRCLKAADLHAVDPQNMKGADKQANPQTGSSPTPKFPILQTLWKLQGRTCLWSSFKAPGRQRRWLVNHLPKATKVRVLKGHDFVAQMVPIRRKLIISEGQPWPTLTSQFCTA